MLNLLSRKSLIKFYLMESLCKIYFPVHCKLKTMRTHFISSYLISSQGVVKVILKKNFIIIFLFFIIIFHIWFVFWVFYILPLKQNKNKKKLFCFNFHKRAFFRFIKLLCQKHYIFIEYVGCLRVWIHSLNLGKKYRNKFLINCKCLNE